MTQMEQNNLEAQLNLYQEIESEYGKITFSVNSAATELEGIFKKRTKGKEPDTWVLNHEDMIEIQSKIRYLKEQKLSGISSYCKDSMETIFKHKKLLEILNKKS